MPSRIASMQGLVVGIATGDADVRSVCSVRGVSSSPISETMARADTAGRNSSALQQQSVGPFEYRGAAM
eukprot:1327732-Rhodomonas_salina.1